MSHHFIAPWNKSRSRTQWPKKFNLSEFPEDGVSNFIENMKNFLQSAEVEEYTIASNRVICLLVLDEESKALFPVYVIEEDMANARTQRDTAVCGHCIGAGWGGNFTSKFRWHFIIPHSKQWDKPLHAHCLVNLRFSCFHGLIHSNGYGHLIKGIDTEKLSKGKILDLWDNICSHLKARMISVVDVYRFRSMVDGFSFYGERNYSFHRCSYGYSEVQWEEAREMLATSHLNDLLLKLTPIGREQSLQELIEIHGNAGVQTLRDLMICIFTAGSCPDDFDATLLEFFEDLLFLPAVDDLYGAVKIFLRSKPYLVKNIPPIFDEQNFRLVHCGIKINPDLRWPNSPAEEFLLVSVYSTVGDLIALAKKTLQETYFVAEHLQELDDPTDGTNLLEIMFRVHPLPDSTLLYEGGSADWMVHCYGCEVKEDDGELMIMCENCEIWQHVLCLGLEEIPENFVCARCSS